MRYFYYPFVLILVLLVSCTPAPAPVQPTPPPALLPVNPEPTIRPTGPAPTVVAKGTSLPGRLLFVNAGDLWIWEGEQGHQLTSSGDAFQPAWSPDGTRIAYIERGESYSDLLLLPASGGESTRLTVNRSDYPLQSYERVYDSVWAFYPTFSPDGREIAFVSQYGPPFGSPASEYHLGLFTISTGAGARRTLRYVDDTGQIGRVAYAPDGSAIVFGFSVVGQDPQLRLMRYMATSGTVAEQADAPEQSYDPAFSPDGRWLAFALRDSGRTDVFMIPSSGGAPVRLTSLGTARAPAFSPDGKYLAFLAIGPGMRGFDLWVLELQDGPDGISRPGQPRQLTTDLGIDADSGVAWGN